MSTIEPTWFAGRLRELRERAGLSQEGLAERAGMARSGVANLEQGRTMPMWVIVCRLCEALGVNAGVFQTAPSPDTVVPPAGRPRKTPAEESPPPKRPRGRPRKT